MWDLRTPHIEGNACVDCHRMGMRTVELFDMTGFIDIGQTMPPYAPGSENEDFEAIRACWEAGPDNVDGCAWVNPPGEYCTSDADTFIE